MAAIKKALPCAAWKATVSASAFDGVNLPDSEENSLYARYGNFNSSRLSIDPELVRNIEIVKAQTLSIPVAVHWVAA